MLHCSVLSVMEGPTQASVRLLVPEVSAMSQPSHPTSAGGRVTDYYYSARTAAALLALTDATLARLGITRAEIRALAVRLVD